MVEPEQSGLFQSVPASRKPKASRRPPNVSKMSRMKTQKPLRPLTAYHIFTQLEKEYIMQKNSESRREKSTGKNFEEDEAVQARVARQSGYLPRRYWGIELAEDWCANPGNRKRRRHRKSRHRESTVGFVELSRMVAARWAELDTIDAETFKFVHELAAEKRREMDQYNKMIAASGQSAPPEDKMPRKKLHVGSKRRPGSSSTMRITHNKPSRKNRIPRRKETFYKHTDLEVDLCEKCTSESAQVVSSHGPSSVAPEYPMSCTKTKRMPADLAPSGDMVDVHDNDILQMWTGK